MRNSVKQCTNDHRRESGLTLIELLVTVVISSIVLAFAVSSFTQLIANNRITSGINTLISNLQLARSEAIKRPAKVILCPHPADADEPDEFVCANQNTWHTGYILFADDNESGNRDTATEDIIRIFEGNANNPVTIQFNQISKKVTFEEHGTSGGSAGTFTFCDSNDLAAPRALVLSNVGRAYTSDTKPNGDALVCP